MNKCKQNEKKKKTRRKEEENNSWLVGDKYKLSKMKKYMREKKKINPEE